jgi:hypothetical protein
VGFRAIGRLLEACGRDCTRNRFAGVMEGGFHETVGAACPIDFTKDPHQGGTSADLYEAYRTDAGKPAWRATRRCVVAGA